jgi:RHS repeat-associated protein
MLMPGRKYQAGSSSYRYGFNGKEKDNEVKGEGNQQDYGMRIYDPRLVRFLSVDPITKKYPQLTPYQFASNSPISGVDLDGLEYNNSSTYVHKVLPLLKKPTAQYIPQQQATISADWNPNGTPQSRNLQGEQRKNEAYNKATMDPLAGSMIYPVANSVGQFTEGTIQHGYGIYEGVQERNYWNAAKNTGLLVLDIAPFVPFKGGTAIETFYRTMSVEQAAIFEKTGVMTAGSETMISPTAAYAKSFTGVTFEINTKAGTLKDLLKIGVSDPAHSLTKSLDLPALKSGWMKENAFFKMESNSEAGLGEQINIGLGNGKALTRFNKNITSFKKISTQPPPQ